MRARKSYLILASATIAIVCGGFLYIQTAYGVTRTWDGGGTDGACGGAGTAADWSCAVNWSADTAPTASDVASFDNTCASNCSPNINTAISIAGINMAATYAGTITQNGTNSITIGTSHWVQAGGTFTGGSGAMNFNGTFTLSGGTFTSTSGIMTISRPYDANMFTVSAGTFSHNNGTIVFAPPRPYYLDNGTFTIDVPTTITLYDVSVLTDSWEYVGGCAAYPATITVAGGDTVIVANDFTFGGANASMDSQIGGAWEVQGNVNIGAYACGGSGTLTMTGSSAKTYSSAGGLAPIFAVNKSGATVSPAGGTTSLNTEQFVLSAGTFTAPSGTMTVGVRSSSSMFTVSAGTFSHNNGTIVFAPSRPNYYDNGAFTIDVPTTITLYDVSVLADSYEYSGGCAAYPATITVAGGDTVIVANDFTFGGANASMDSQIGGAWEVQGNVNIGAYACGGSGILSFTGGNNQTYTDQGGNEPDGSITINKTDGIVSLASDAGWNAASQNLAITAGVLEATGTYNINTNALTIGSTGALEMTGTGDLTLGGNASNAGQLIVQSNQACGGTDDIQILSSSAGVQRTWSGSGSYIIYDATVKDQGGSSAITAYSSTSISGNGGNWTFSGAACPSVSPAMQIGSGFINIGSGVVNVR